MDARLWKARFMRLFVRSLFLYNCEVAVPIINVIIHGKSADLNASAAKLNAFHGIIFLQGMNASLASLSHREK